MVNIRSCLISGGIFHDEGGGMLIKNLEFEKTCCACPEQYDVYFNDRQVGYIRLRYGVLRVDYPECMDETIYSEKIGGEYMGEFEFNGQRDYYLKFIADLIWERIRQEGTYE